MVDAHTKQLEKSFHNILIVSTKLLQSGDTAQKNDLVIELGSKFEEFDAICDELCNIIEYNKQKIQSNLAMHTTLKANNTSTEITNTLQKRAESTQKLRHLLSDFTLQLQQSKT